MERWIALVTIVAFCGIFGSDGKLIKYKDCGSRVGKVVQVDVSPCTSEPCTFIKGKKAGVLVTFMSNETNPTATVVVHGIVSGIPVPWPVPQTNACLSGLDPTCPLTKGGRYSYKLQMDIQKEWPDIQFVVKVELKDGASNDYFCVAFPGQLKSPKLRFRPRLNRQNEVF